MGNRFWI
ncbi:hypothetical protein CP8484711_0290A, partial [Chlamydia psittaci 84-8471/1]